jgi:hypothetical protein
MTVINIPEYFTDYILPTPERVETSSRLSRFFCFISLHA